MPRYNVQIEDQFGETYSFTVDADEEGQAADLGMESAINDGLRGCEVVDVEETD
jgi:hypothetical protein